MKVQIEKRDLVALIGKTQNIVEKKNTMPVLVNVLLEANSDSGNQLRAFATDLEVSITDSVPCKILNPGKVAVNAKKLFEITKELLEGQIQLTKKENYWLEIRQGKYVSTIVGISAEEYPVFPTNQSSNFVKLDSSVLKEMIDKTIYSVSTDETRYHLNGVYFEQKPDSGYTMVATDGHRLSLIRKNVSGSKSLTHGQGVIIPRKGLNEIKKLIDMVDGEFEVAIEGAQLIIRHDQTIIMVRLIEGKYPNYQQFIPQKLSQKIQINREAFLRSLKRVSLTANQKSQAVTLQLSKGKMEITSNNPEVGDAKEEIEVDYSGSDLKIGFNARYITDVLNAINDEEIDFEINDQLSPGLVRPHNDANYTCVVMPMRI